MIITPRPKGKRKYRYCIEGWSASRVFSCAHSYFVEATGFDDAVDKVKTLMRRKNIEKDKAGDPLKYSEITSLELVSGKEAG